MKDLDFDELDRAVNSLMTNVSKTPEPKKSDENEQTLTITPTLKDDAAPSFKTLDKTVAQINGGNENAPASTPSVKSADTPVAALEDKGDKPSSSQPLASRRGRFMDMVRPNTAPRTPEVTRATSRQGNTIEPKGPLLSDVVAPSVPTGLTSKKPNDLDTTSKDSSSEWPDPIEMTSSDDYSKEETSASAPVENEPEKPAVESSYTPLTTPFLTDTKVEKRPLGGAVIETDTAEPTETEPAKEQKNGDEAAQLPADPTEIAPLQLPEELSGDLVALEADANTAAVTPDVQPDASPVAEAIEPSQKPHEPVVDAVDDSAISSQTSKAVPDPEEKLLPSGPISIPQQYREEPSTGDKQNGSIYDTDTYHQPLSHPAKKKSGWMWVIWIVVILIVGAGCGVALYYMDIL